MFVEDYTVDVKVEMRITNAAAKVKVTCRCRQEKEDYVTTMRESVEMRITNASEK